MISHGSDMVNLLARVRNFPDPLDSTSVGIFARDHVLSSLFGLIMALVRIHAIP